MDDKESRQNRAPSLLLEYRTVERKERIEMPLRDYELVQKAKRDGWVKISVNWLLTPLECDPVACNGRCCKSHNSVLHPSYHPDEVYKLPQELRQFLMEDGVSVRWNSNGNCTLIPYCIKNNTIIPTDCRLFPLGFSKWGRLIIKKPAF